MGQTVTQRDRRADHEHLLDLPWLAALDVAAKVLLVLAMVQVALDPAWGNLEGKAPGTRAMTYPLLALVVPVTHLWRHPGRRYPWGTDLLVTLPAFSDILGNRLDLYDRLVWFDDLIHAVNAGALGVAVVLVCGAGAAPAGTRIVLAVASAMTLSLVWEVWEYYAFVTRSSEASTAYADTLGDLALGWLGAVAGGMLMGNAGSSSDSAGFAPIPHAPTGALP